MNLLQKAADKAKKFLQNTKNTLKKTKRDITKEFKRKYLGKKNPSNFIPGKLLTFEYNAIDADKVFDKKPLIVCLGFPKDSNKHILGLNVHWLPEMQRVLLASLISTMLEKKDKLEYEDIKPLIKKFEGSPILRRYAIRRISPKVVEMPRDVYLRAASLDYADWSK